MEDALGDLMWNMCPSTVFVLILVLMEDALGVCKRFLWQGGRRMSLNPCFNGRCSRRKSCNQERELNSCVLILVLMEDALGGEFIVH